MAFCDPLQRLANLRPSLAALRRPIFRIVIRFFWLCGQFNRSKIFILSNNHKSAHSAIMWRTELQQMGLQPALKNIIARFQTNGQGQSVPQTGGFEIKRSTHICKRSDRSVQKCRWFRSQSYGSSWPGKRYQTFHIMRGIAIYTLIYSSFISIYNLYNFI